MCGNENLWPFQKDEKNIINDLFYMYNNWTEDLVYESEFTSVAVTIVPSPK